MNSQQHPDTGASAINPHDGVELSMAFGGELGQLLQEYVRRDGRGAELSALFRVYYRLRRCIPIPVRQMLQRRRNRKMNVAAQWYLPSEFLAAWKHQLTNVLGRDPDRQVIHPWPDGHSWSSVLTHDVETAVGVRLAPELARLEERYGFRSAWNFVPHKYPIDSGVIKRLTDAGHEIGIHGYNHDGRLFESRRTFDGRRDAINQALWRYQSVGFRAPMVHRNLLWLQSLDIQYDESCFDIDPFQATPGGVGSPWPFIAGRFVELPYTLPQDHTLLVALGETSPRIWIDKLNHVRDLSGMAMLITHPDYLDSPARLQVYEQFLDYLSQQSDQWNTLPLPLSQWWRHRDDSEITGHGQPISGHGQPITGPASERGRTVRLADLFAKIL